VLFWICRNLNKPVPSIIQIYINTMNSWTMFCFTGSASCFGLCSCTLTHNLANKPALFGPIARPLRCSWYVSRSGILCPVLFWSPCLSCPPFPCTSCPCDCLPCPWFLFPPVWLLAPPWLCPPVSHSTVSNHLHLPCVFKLCLSLSPVWLCTV